MKFQVSRGRLLAGVALAGLSGLCAPAMAGQEVDAEARQDVIVVTATPIQDSQLAAIEAKRDALNVMDIISADTIGRFPDQNLADSLARLPGLAVERDQGQARYVNFRGAPFRYTVIAFDGIDVLGAEDGRTPRFDSFPSVITRAVEANKAITPDMPGSAVAGFVNIRAFDPFEREGFGASLEAGVGEQELGDGAVQKYNARVSFSNDNFGALAFYSKNRRRQVTDNREFDLGRDPATGGLLVNSLDYRMYFVDRRDEAYGVSLEYRPDHEIVDRVFANYLFSEFTDLEQRNQYVLRIAEGAARSRTPLAVGPQGYQPVVRVRRLLQDGEYINSTDTLTLGADLMLGGWDVEARVNLTDTSSEIFLPIPFSLNAEVAVEYDVRNINDPRVQIFDRNTRNVRPTGLSGLAFPVTLGLLIPSDIGTEATKYKLDAKHDMSLLGLEGTFKTGLAFDSREASGFGFAQIQSAFPSSVNINSFDTRRPWFSDFANDINGTIYDNRALIEAWRSAVGGFNLTIPGDLLISLEEDIAAVYGMGTLNFNKGNITLGARIEQTEYTSRGPSLNIAVSDSYVNVLPSVHFNYDITETLKFRASGSTGVSRPTYPELRASASVNPTNETITGGNPFLKAEDTIGVDGALEWYYQPGSLVALTAFQRSISNVIYSDSVPVDAAIYVPSAAGETWTLIGFANGGNGRLSGIEFNAIVNADDFAPALEGFGANFNATWLDSEFSTRSGATFSLPGTSDTVYNASVFYERFGLSARVNWQQRSAWLSTTENDSFAEFWDEQERVDLSVRYLLPQNLWGARMTVFANGNNLTDAVDVRYIGTAATPNQVEGYGRHWVLGVRVDY
jgi:TonB-dependent receptor